MPVYEFRCEHGIRAVARPMAEAALPVLCAACDGPMRRIYTASAIVMRPDGYALKPGDKGYWDFNRQQELHQLRGPSHEVNRFLDESLTKREDPVVTYTYDQQRELRNFGEMVDREIRENVDIPELLREDI